MSERPVRPSAYFDYGQDAIESLCRGCRDERGWIDLVNERDPVCENMLAIQDDAVGSVVLRDGRPVCPMRPKPVARKRATRTPEVQMRLFEGDGLG